MNPPKIPWKGTKEYSPKKTIVLRKPSDWPKGIGKVYEKNGVLVIDGERKWRLNGKNMPGKCDQNEKNEPILRIRMPVIFRNFEIFESHNGLTWNCDGVIFENLVFTKICEDGINPMNTKNGIIRNCYFICGPDKTIQWNRSKNVEIYNNIFIGGRNAIRLMGSDSNKIYENEFYNTDTAIHVTWGGHLKIKKLDNKFTNVKTPFKTEDGGKITFL